MHRFVCCDFHKCFLPVFQEYSVLLATFVVWVNGEVWEVSFAPYSDYDEVALTVASTCAVLCARKDSSIERVLAVSHMNFQSVRVWGVPESEFDEIFNFVAGVS